MGVRPNTLSTPPVFPQLWIYFMIKNRQIIFPKVVYRTPPENAFMNVYFYFYSVVKCGNRALGINERIKKIFLDTKTNPNPPLSRSDRGPSGGPVLKGFRKRAPSGQSKLQLSKRKIKLWEAHCMHFCMGKLTDIVASYTPTNPSCNVTLKDNLTWYYKRLVQPQHWFGTT
jgi:hypothetical protein